MLSKTHIAIGTAGALTILQPQTIENACPVMVGAIVGSVLCDIDCKIGDSKDAVFGRAIAGVVSAVAIYIDVTLRGLMSSYWKDASILAVAIGLAIFIITALVARKSEHRVFSHSFLVFVLYAVGIFLCCRPAAVAFIIGFTSHLLLDLLTFRPVYLFYPLKRGFSLRLCKSKSIVNTAIMIIGYAWLLIAIVFLFI